MIQRDYLKVLLLYGLVRFLCAPVHAYDKWHFCLNILDPLYYFCMDLYGWSVAMASNWLRESTIFVWTCTFFLSLRPTEGSRQSLVSGWYLSNRSNDKEYGVLIDRTCCISRTVLVYFCPCLRRLDRSTCTVVLRHVYVGRTVLLKPTDGRQQKTHGRNSL